MSDINLALLGGQVDTLFRAVIGPGNVNEVRVQTSDDGFKNMWHGCFTEARALLTAAHGKNRIGVWVQPNPLVPQLLSRAANKLVKATKNDPWPSSPNDIECWRFLCVEVDSKRRSGTLASDEQHERAIAFARDIAKTLQAEQWNEPAILDSGQASSLLFRVNLPNTPQSSGLVRDVLIAIAGRFCQKGLRINTRAFVPNFEVVLPGSILRTADEAPGNLRRRPAVLLSVPTTLVETPIEILRATSLDLGKSECHMHGEAEDETEQGEEKEDDAVAEGQRYGTNKVGLTYRSSDENERTLQLTNFNATIREDIISDDGATNDRSFRIDATVNRESRSVLVPAKDFGSMSWVPTELGSTAIIYPHRYGKERVRAAIQSLSGNVPERRLYRHTGWRRINGELGFLHAGGAIGLPDCQTDLISEKLDRYNFPSDHNAVIEGIRASLEFLQCCPPHIGYSLLALVYRAPLCEMLPCTLMTHFEGQSGTFKTSLAVAALAHFGNFVTKVDAPARWQFTGTILEKIAFLAKDVPLLIDDLNPETTQRLRQNLEENFSRIIGAVGDNTGKRRATETIATRPEYFPRGVIISTGEYTPQLVTSRLGRLLVVRVEKGDITVNKITELQGRLHLLPHAMFDFIDYVRQHFDTVGTEVRERFHSIRAGTQGIDGHQRLPENVAQLYIGLEQCLKFAERVGVLKQRQVQEHLDKGLQAFTGLSSKHGQLIKQESPTARFISAIRQGLSAGTCHLVDKKTGAKYLEHLPLNSKMIGWLDWTTKIVYLLPDLGYNFVCDHYKSQNGFPTTIDALKTALKAEKLILLTESDIQDQRNESRLTIRGQREYVLKFPRHVFVDVIDEVKQQELAAENEVKEFEKGVVQ